jgi:CBS domain-containing protein
MDRDLTALTEDITVEEAIETLLRHHMTGLPVIDDQGKVIGFVSEEDIIKSALPAYISNLPSSSFLPDYGQFSQRLAAIASKPVSDVMHRNCVTFDVDESDFAVASTMISKHIKIAPVMKDGIMVGYISRAYLIKRMMRSYGNAEHPAEANDSTL